MTDIIYFDPLDSFCRSCRGAVEQNSEITFRIKLMRTRLTSVKLIAVYDRTGDRREFPMQWTDFAMGYDIYQCTMQTEAYKGLIWYWFEAVDAFGKCAFFGENASKQALSYDLPSAFQLTVYDRNIKTPDWYCRGVTYHVFVDRFFRASDSAKLSDDPYFFVHTDMAEVPEYLPNEDGEILNRDIYGGNLKGIEEKLEYLNSLGVTTLYLSPIFEAWSNHKYNTADYMKIDPHFGDEAALRSLCAAASEYGMRVILDGVFNHTGSDSRYFNREGRYDSVGAYQSELSPYRSWYSFDESPVGYQSWWGISTLPAVNESEESYQSFIMGDGGVAEHWLKMGISGWRLDVADELPDEFLIRFHKKVRDCKADAVVIGEVWEDASNKIAYGVRRTYFTESELDGVMNYPVKDGILGFLTHCVSAEAFAHAMETLLDHYPPQMHACLMNLIGTHDTARAMNALACPELLNSSRDFKAHHKMDAEMRARARRKLKMASCLQYAFPGSPSLYYGDETAMEGFEDPFNRRFFPWNDMDGEMITHYQKLGEIKRSNTAMHHGEFKIIHAAGDCIAILREHGDDCVFFAVNRGGNPCEISFPYNGEWIDAFSDAVYTCDSDGCIAEIPPEGFFVMTLKK